MNDHAYYMSMAIAKAREGVVQGQTPFGACIVKEGRVLSCAHNEVWQHKDITAHAEIQAIREACRDERLIDLTGSVIYSTCEPCPMCFSACHWAKIDKIVYGAYIADAAQAGFHELCISNHQLKELGQAPVNIQSGFMRDEAVLLFTEWLSRVDRRAY